MVLQFSSSSQAHKYARDHGFVLVLEGTRHLRSTSAIWARTSFRLSPSKPARAWSRLACSPQTSRARPHSPPLPGTPGGELSNSRANHSRPAGGEVAPLRLVRRSFRVLTAALKHKQRSLGRFTSPRLPCVVRPAPCENARHSDTAVQWLRHR